MENKAIERIRVSTGRPYEVLVGEGLHTHAGEHIAAVLGAETLALVTDSTVGPLYAPAVERSLAGAGFVVRTFVLPAGEAHKTLSSCAEILAFFAACGLTRSDAVVALGGGVVGDTAGFAASIYQRGIDFVQIPTTLLAACDASVGGKTAVDLPQGKNLVGAFHQPRQVLCDTAAFASLPAPIFRDGMAEVVKHALIADRPLYDRLLSGTVPLPELVARNVAIKAAVVAGDEREQGQRRILNFGHTLGHAIETLSAYTISHGSAVAMGMALCARGAERTGLSPAGTEDAVTALLDRFGLPHACPFGGEELFTAALSDKKRSGSRLHLVTLSAIGTAQTHALTLPEFRIFVEAAL